MKRSITITLLSFALALATAARAEPRTWLGLGASLQSRPEPMLGDAREIVDGLGLARDDPSLRIAPRARAAFELGGEPRSTVAVLGEVSWYSDSIHATGAVQYRARRDVIPVNALLRLTPGSTRTRFLFEVGPALAISRFAEKGWLGDSTQTKLAPGCFLMGGGRSELTPEFGMIYGVSGQWLYLPQNNPLLADGGSAWTVGLTLAFEYGL
jgi:hypothetical protein